MAQSSIERQKLAERGIGLLKELLEENTTLTKQVEELTQQIHGKVVAT